MKGCAMTERRCGKDRRVKQVQIYGQDRRKGNRRVVDTSKVLKLD